MLRRLGYTVVEAKNLDDCIEVLSRIPKVDLLMTDVIMPGANGRQVQEAVAAIRPEVKTLFMSGYTEDVVGQHGLLEDHIHFISKPFTEKGLSRKVREVLNLVPGKSGNH
jgi:YesN/AraC family two-component response regulator